MSLRGIITKFLPSVTKKLSEISLNLLYMFTVALARSFNDKAIILRKSGFVDDVVFSHNGANVAEATTTLFFVKFARWRPQGRSLISTIA